MKRAPADRRGSRSLVAPVSAETGLIVMLPQSLYQTSLRTSARPSASNRTRRARRRPRRCAPTRRRRLADDQPFAEVVADQAGLGHEAARWTTQPSTRSIGSAASSRPPGSTSRAAFGRRGRGHEPPGHAVHRRHDDGRGTEQGRDRRCQRRQRRCLEGNDDELLGPSAPRSSLDLDPRDVSPRLGFDEQALLADPGQGFAARQCRDGSRPRPCVRRSGRRRPQADDGDLHGRRRRGDVRSSTANLPRNGTRGGFFCKIARPLFQLDRVVPDLNSLAPTPTPRRGDAAPPHALMKGARPAPDRRRGARAGVAHRSRGPVDRRSRQATGMSKSGVFAHFGSREECRSRSSRVSREVEEEVFRPSMAAARGLPRCTGPGSLAEAGLGRDRLGLHLHQRRGQFDDRPGRCATRWSRW